MNQTMKLDYTDVSFRNNGKLKLLIIVGTRPEIIRLSAVIAKWATIWAPPWGTSSTAPIS